MLDRRKFLGGATHALAAGVAVVAAGETIYYSNDDRGESVRVVGREDRSIAVKSTPGVKRQLSTVIIEDCEVHFGDTLSFADLPENVHVTYRGCNFIQADPSKPGSIII